MVCRVGMRRLVTLSQGVRWDYYVDPVSGSPLNSGRSPAAAKASLADISWTSGLRVAMLRGATALAAIDRTAITLTVPVRIGAVGAGYSPVIAKSVRHTSGWSNVSGTIYGKSIGYTAINAFWLVGDTVTKLTLGTYGSITSGQFAVSGSTVQINIGVDPAAQIIEIPASGATDNIVIGTGANGTIIEDISSWFASQNGVEISSVDDAVVRRLDIRYNGNDGIGVHGDSTPALRAVIDRCTIKRNGQIRTTSGGAGDGVSFHSVCTGQILYCDIQDNEKSGISNQHRTSVDTVGCYLRNNNQEIFVISEVSSAAGGTHKFASNVIVVPGSSNAGSSALQVCNADATQPPTVTIANNTIYGESIVANRSGVRIVDGVVTARNNIISGFARGYDWRSTDAASSSLSNNYDCVYGNTSNYFNNGTPGVSAGANDITTDPKFVNAGSLDFRLQSDSPCRGTGVAVAGVTDDRLGSAFAAPPSRGAYEYA